MLYSSYSGTDYVVQMSGRQLAGRVWGLGVRATGASRLDSVNLYNDLNSTNNLYLYSWLSGLSAGRATSVLGASAVGNVSSNSWYQLAVKVHSNAVDVYKDGSLRIQATDNNLSSGAIGLYGEGGTTVQFNNVFVRQYTAVEPSCTVGAATPRG